MADDRIGTPGKRPKKTIGGWDVEEQYRFTIGIGGGRYVIVGHSDGDYQDELEKLMATAVKPIVRKHKRSAIDEQRENEGDS